MPDLGLYWETRCTPLRNCSGQVTGAIGLTINITDRKLAQQELQRFLEISPDIFCMADFDGYFKSVSPAFEHSLGWTTAELLAKPYLEFIHPDDRAATAEAMEKSVRLGQPVYSFENRYISKDGNWRWLQWNTHVVPSEQLICGMARDVTDAKQSRQRLRAQFEVARILSESKAPDKTIQQVLRTICETLSWDVGEIWTLEPNSKFLRLDHSWTSGTDKANQFVKESAKLRLPLDGSLPGKVWLERSSIWISDVENHSEYTRTRFAAQDDLQSAFGCPIVIGREMKSVMVFFTLQVRPMDHDMHDTISAIARQVGQFIERKRSDEARFASERRFTQAFNFSPYPMCIASAEGRFINVNEAFIKAVELDRDQIIGSTNSDLGLWTSPEDRRRFLNVIRDRRQLKNFETVLKKQNGEERTVLLSAESIELDGQPHLLGAFDDITERKSIVEALRSSEERFQQFMNNSPVLASITDEQTRVLYVSKAWLDLFHLRPDEVIGRTAFDRFPLPLAERVFEQTQRVLSSGEVVESIEVFTGTDGETRQALVYRFPMPERTGQQRLGSVAIDITERRNVEQALAEQRSFLRQIIDTDPNLIFAKNRAGRYTLVNQSLADVYGCTVEELTGKVEMDMHSVPAEAMQWREDDLEVLETLEEKFVAEEALTDATGKLRWLQTVKRPIFKEDGTADQVLGVATDITERKHAADALKRSEDELLQAQKMEAIGRLAGGVAHDFNNLLNVMLGYTELLLYTLNGDDPLRSYAEHIRHAADRAAGLTRQLLAFSRKQVLLPVVIDLNSVLADVGKLLPRLIGDDVDIAVLPSLEPLFIKADPIQIQQIIMNLAGNARDAMPEGGKFTIQSGTIELDEEYARQHANLPAGQYAVLSVVDTGTGMSAETRAHLFEPFFTTKEVGRGTGLGLSMVYGIVKQSGGSILVFSEPGQGTAYTIYLPAVETPETSVSAKHFSIDEPLRGSETILLVEDQQGLRTLAKEFLGRQGYKVLEAARPSEAMAISDTYAGTIHLLLTDVIMPGMNGRALAKKLRPQRKDMKVLYVSGFTQEVLERSDVSEPELSFMEKPFTLEALAKKVREVLDSDSLSNAISLLPTG
ncbi:MAG: multi-sensor hybrid histidine kinase [Candidatus Angelobacter sp.]|nr:multi-sensor hybrid histidine kinase [Candidatus Angelobacter sp.]